MQLIHTVTDLKRALAGQCDVTLVPTMGNLHQGHLSLVQAARRGSGLLVASVFVNQLQFAPHEDFLQYPRTLESDCALLESGGCDIVFAPAAGEVYPEPQRCTVAPDPELADVLEGSFRPGFFNGVCTVVMKLFGIVQPSTAVFGKKDYQQLLVVRHMVRQFALPIVIEAVETVRSERGLALSSRNGYLSAEQRVEAASLYAVLGEVREGLATVAAGGGGTAHIGALEEKAMSRLVARGWSPDYVAIRRRADLRAAVPGEPVVILAAAKLGSTRLIDNLEA